MALPSKTVTKTKGNYVWVAANTSVDYSGEMEATLVNNQAVKDNKEWVDKVKAGTPKWTGKHYL